MSHQVTIGGERLGNNNNMKATLNGYERSTHDLGYVWRSTMAAGTLVPFMAEVALPGDTFDIELNLDVLTHPTIGPLFGSYKVQLDLFQVPVRLYQAKLRTNRINIGNDMSAVKLPLLNIEAVGELDITRPMDNQQIHPSCLLSYLNIRGVGQKQPSNVTGIVSRDFQATTLLGYWDIYKNYYANKQEEIGVVIHKDVTVELPELVEATLDDDGVFSQIKVPANTEPEVETILNSKTRIIIEVATLTNDNTADQFNLIYKPGVVIVPVTTPLVDIFNNVYFDIPSNEVYFSDPKDGWKGLTMTIMEIVSVASANTTLNPEPTLTTFPLANIDEMLNYILESGSQATPFMIGKGTTLTPYNLLFQDNAPEAAATRKYSKQFAQEGLAIKTYDSDLFNNWVDKEWIDGPDGVGEVTKIDTSEGSFTIDELNLKSKIYDMLNRIAISGGTYEDWLDAVYDHDRRRTFDTPMYLGGMMQTLVFDEVVSNAAAGDQPLGTLAGRGRLANNRKGGKTIAKIDEISYIMGIVSITPKLDYSQGNKWDTKLLTLNDFHKPALDQIGFQDLITDQMAWWDTVTSVDGNTVITKSAGKQPAWINYMTNVNQVRGNFAIPNNQGFMVLDRSYTPRKREDDRIEIADLTTYIDPVKFNNIFADTQLDAQNFWVQIGLNIEARRKMSAKIMPNL